ncbi:Octopamine receptor beta-2R-like protein [Leptotrombidium deliense]|uniref:Octopamine receptor beta-2R-like protein n=1 Tax=Leptotrombidium deliense TaxID=299467 RepID=A0A443SU00_9ACAR|nr:Octopamine receptor beta-2R-like protein [Leptotrombidium deliense]
MDRNSSHDLMTTFAPFMNVTDNNSTVPGNSTGGATTDGSNWVDTLLFTLKILVLVPIIISAIFGNLLVIISVFRHHKLRISTNYFIVSLAVADMLVAIFAMTFRTSIALYNRWLYNQIVCDFYNACDVLFSTASICNLGCISIDRYYAIIKPLDYPMKITNKTVSIMLAIVWVSSFILASFPIVTGIYTTSEHLDYQKTNPPTCEFVVNHAYALISSSISFWIPAFVMVFTYWKIYQEATKQEKMICKTQMMAQQNNARNSADHSSHITVHAPPHRNSHGDDPESGQSTPTKRCINKMKREHKAAKTLGIIMGCFIACWLPFFTVYVIGTFVHINELYVDILFWIGYLNSSLNPILYAYFNREFREAFKETIQNVFCCCFKSSCLEGRRNNSAIHFNCTYRSTQDIGLVENKYVKD